MKVINKQDNFLKKVHQEVQVTHPNITLAQVKTMMNAFFNTIGKATQNCESIALYGHAKIFGKVKPASTSRNPKTGEPCIVAEKVVPYFQFVPAYRNKVRTKKF